MDEIGLAEKSPPETGGEWGGGARNCQSRQGNKRSEKWNWWEGFGDWYSCWVLIDRAREWNKTQPFLFPSCACKAFRGLHLKTQEEFNGQKHFSKCMKRYLS